MDLLGGRQVAFNAACRGQWEAFAEHRRCLTDVLARGATSRGSRLCVLGAGNANDLDLPALLAAHREVHLVDIDAESLALGAARQGVAGHPGLRLHGGVDVTATLGVLSGWSPTSAVGRADLDALAAWPVSRAAAVLPGGFDRVASTCLLSQVLETAAHALGRGHRQLADVEAALLAGHLRLMARLAAPGGEAVLVAESVSSDTLAELPSMSPDELAGLQPRLHREGNHFRGMHPQHLLAALRADPSVGPRVASAASLMPWLWRLHARTYLVGGLAFRLGTDYGR
ncbi:MAG: hypothetical protein JWN86_4325 [Planctomycetota bacterium]|nr:hypothetical protein [Planctomycetota bacterium]